MAALGWAAMGTATVDERRLTHGANSPTAPARAQARERERQALRLRAAGRTFAEIGAALGVSKQSAHEAVGRALAKTVEDIRERAEELRAVESAKLDRAEEAIRAKVEEGDLRAVEVLLKVAARRAALLGLDLKPEPVVNQQQVIVVGGPLPEDRDREHVIDVRLPWDRQPGEEGYQALPALTSGGR